MRTQLKMNSVAEPILWLMHVLRGDIENVDCGEVLYPGTRLYASFTVWAANGGYKHNYTERMFLQSINKIRKSEVIARDGKSIRGYIFNQEECLIALKLYLKLPDFNLDEI
jgi:hypothetical protein